MAPKKKDGKKDGKKDKAAEASAEMTEKEVCTPVLDFEFCTAHAALSRARVRAVGCTATRAVEAAH